MLQMTSITQSHLCKSKCSAPVLGVGLATTVATAVGVPGAIDVASVTGMPFATGNVGPGAGLVVKAARTASWNNGGCGARASRNPEVWMKRG